MINIIPEVSDYADYCKNNLKKYKFCVKREERKEKRILKG